MPWKRVLANVEPGRCRAPDAGREGPAGALAEVGLADREPAPGR